ncbi:hypothetical protein Peetri_00173 [Pseudomonas phage vB_PpuM-Peetri]
MGLGEMIAGALRKLNTHKTRVLPTPSRVVSFSWPLEDSCMMMAIAKHYEVSNSNLGAELFAPMIMEIFKQLPEEIRGQIAADADELMADFVKKYKSRESVDLTTWQGVNVQLGKEDT